MTHTSNHVVTGEVWGGGAPARADRASSALARQTRPSGTLTRTVVSAVEVDIVPRLIMAHATPPVAARKPATDAIARFTELVLARDVDAACSFVAGLRAQGAALEDIYLDLLAPTARHLRLLWSTDVCDFAEVTLALWRLQQILREFSAAFRNEFDHREHGLRVLLAPAPGEKQELGYVMFGLVMVAEFFRREGWDTWIEPDSSNGDFQQLVNKQSFDVVEFLVSGDKRLDALASSVSSVRRVSANRSVGVMVCGPAFTENPELVLMVGADMTAADPRQGVSQAQNLVGLLASRG